MKKYTTADRLKQLMSERNLKQIDILQLCKPYCEKYNVKLGKNDLSQYVNGKNTPGQDKLTILALALHVEETWLMGYEIGFSDTDLSKYGIRPIKTKKFPMLGEIACGEPIYADQDYETYVEASSDINADFCVTAKGDSMINARIFDGDIIFIHSQPDVDNGEIAAVIIEDTVTLKRVYKYPDRLELRPENPTHRVQNYEGEELNQIRILGKAVAFQSYVR